MNLRSNEELDENTEKICRHFRHWEFINEQISKTFRGEKTKVKNIEK